MNDGSVLEKHKVPDKALAAATQLDRFCLGRESSLEPVREMIDWLEAEACRIRLSSTLTDRAQFRMMGLLEVVAPHKLEYVREMKVGDLAIEVAAWARTLRRVVFQIEACRAVDIAPERSFLLKLFDFTHAEVWSEMHRRRFLFA